MAVDRAWMLRVLLQFCTYVENRVQTKNIELLRKMMADFLAPERSTTTLDEFVGVGVNVIAVVPIQVTDESQREDASRLLTMDKAIPDAGRTGDYMDDFRFFFEMINDVVDTRSMRWLEQLFLDFIHSSEDTLERFLRSESHAIAIIPSMRCACHRRRENDEESDDSGWSNKGGVLETSSQDASDSEESRPEADEVSNSESDSTAFEADSGDKFEADSGDKNENGWEAKEKTTANRRPTKRAKVAPADRVDAVAVKVMELEAQEPWVKIYKNVQLPAAALKSTALRNRLIRFWARNARAVWERNFCYLIKDRLRCHERKQRQDRAYKMFLGVITLAYRDLGPGIFVDLDECWHSGWWYRSEKLSMNTLSNALGPAAFGKLIDREAWKTRPFSDGSVNLETIQMKRLKHSPTGSRAMWRVDRSAKEILSEMTHIKRRRQQSNDSTGGDIHSI